MRKSALISVLVLLVVIGIHPNVAGASVAEGRALLFNNGNPTYSGIVAAKAEFAEALVTSPSDPEANLFYAVTRCLSFGLENGDGSGLDTALDLLEAFGIQRAANDSVSQSPPYSPPPELFGEYDPPTTIPTGGEFRSFLAGPVVTLIDGAVANLNQVPQSYSTVLTAIETGQESDTEVDYGDVQLFKAMLLGLKALIQFAAAYNLDFDIRTAIAIDNADLFQLQRDLLDRYANLLVLRGDGSSLLSGARQALLDGIDAYQAALAFITAETDPQADDLFFFGSSEEEWEAQFFLTQLTEIQNSLNENRTASLTTVEEYWTLTDDQNQSMTMELEKDVNGNLIDGEIYTSWDPDTGCQFLFCWGEIDLYEVDGTSLTIRAVDDWSGAVATLTGTLANNQITGGAYSVSDANGTRSGSFTGVLNSSETSTVRVNLNRVFGNTGASPVNIRAVLPEFDRESQPIAGTFPGSPVLNGIFPDLVTNEDLTRDLELAPSGLIDVPAVTDGAIAVDGMLGEWPAALFTDPADDDNDLSPMSGTDLGNFYLARDSAYLYVAMQLNDGNPNTADTTVYLFQANQSSEQDNSNGDRYAAAFYDGQWKVKVGERSWSDPNGLYGPGTTLYESASGVAAGAGAIEWKIPLSEIGSLSGKFVRAYIHALATQPWNINDDNRTRIMLEPVTLSGTVTSAAYTGGKVYVTALDDYGEIVAGTYLTDLSGPYTITGLAEGRSVHLYAIWDADGNGILSEGDYLEYAGAFSVGSSPTVDMALNSPPPSIGITGNVMNLHQPDDSYATFLVIDVLSGYSEPLPYTVENITVTGPSGLNLSMEDFDYYPQWREFVAVLPGQPAIGTYEFHIQSGSSIGSATDTQAVIRNIPLPDPTSFIPQPGGSVSSVNPTFFWDLVDYSEAPLYYRLEIQDPVSGLRTFATARLENTSFFSVPKDELEFGKPYRWRLRITDSGTWETVQNRAQSDWYSFEVKPAGNPAIPLLLLDN